MSAYEGLASIKSEKPPAAHHKRAKYKKAPGAPKRFKSAFIFFSTEKHKEIRAEMGDKGSAEKVRCVRVQCLILKSSLRFKMTLCSKILTPSRS